MTMRSLSVAMTTCDSSEYLLSQLQSIAEQSEPPDELVVADDGSSDDTPSLLRTFAVEAPFPVRIVWSRERQGLIRNVERALRAVTGDVVVLADHDDVWHQDKLSLVRAGMGPTTTLWFSDARLIDGRGSPLAQQAWPAVQLSPERQARIREGRGLEILLHGQTVTGATMAVDARVLAVALPLPDELNDSEHPFLHDGWLAVIAYLMGEAHLEPRPLVDYRQHAAQVTAMSLARSRGGEAVLPGNPRGQLEMEWRRTQIVSSRVASHDSSVFVGARLEEVRSRSLLLSARARGGPISRSRALIRGDYHRFARGFRSYFVDLSRA